MLSDLFPGRAKDHYDFYSSLKNVFCFLLKLIKHANSYEKEKERNHVSRCISCSSSEQESKGVSGKEETYTVIEDRQSLRLCLSKAK